jgi:hypothetical protein
MCGGFHSSRVTSTPLGLFNGFLDLSPKEMNETVNEIRASLSPVRQYAAVAFLPPLVTLVLGLVVSGFARKGAGPLG